MTHILLKQEKSLMSALKSWSASYTAAHKVIHGLFVSVIFHAARHGNVGPLSVFYETLRENDKEQFRLYCLRIFAVLGGWDGTTILPSGELAECVTRGRFFTRKKDVFTMVSNDQPFAKDAKAKFVKIAPEILRPDGKVWHEFGTKNNIKEEKILGDEDLQKALEKLIKRFSGDVEGVIPRVSPKNLEALRAAQRVIGTASNSMAI
jgi:hypothetical protein